ncbi:MAG: hypothetical protein ABWY93_18770 [Mycobacterium sp.]
MTHTSQSIPAPTPIPAGVVSKVLSSADPDCSVVVDVDGVTVNIIGVQYLHERQRFVLQLHPGDLAHALLESRS